MVVDQYVQYGLFVFVREKGFDFTFKQNGGHYHLLTLCSSYTMTWPAFTAPSCLLSISPEQSFYFQLRVSTSTE